MQHSDNSKTALEVYLNNLYKKHDNVIIPSAIAVDLPVYIGDNNHISIQYFYKINDMDIFVHNVNIFADAFKNFTANMLIKIKNQKCSIPLYKKYGDNTYFKFHDHLFTIIGFDKLKNYYNSKEVNACPVYQIIISNKCDGNACDGNTDVLNNGDSEWISKSIHFKLSGKIEMDDQNKITNIEFNRLTLLHKFNSKIIFDLRDDAFPIDLLGAKQVFNKL